jgi:hypothetical protein
MKERIVEAVGAAISTLLRRSDVAAEPSVA